MTLKNTMFAVFYLFLIFGLIKNQRTEPSSCLLENNVERLEKYGKNSFHSEMHREIREKVIKAFPTYCKECKTPGVFYLEGTMDETTMIASTTNEIQNKNFLYMTGVFYYDYSVIIDMTNGTARTILFAHEMTEMERVWYYKKLMTLDELKEKFGVDEIYYRNDANVERILNRIKPKMLFIEKDQKLSFKVPAVTTINDSELKEFLWKQRLVKTEKEIELLQYAMDVTVEAHHHLMKQVKYTTFEYQMGASFIDKTLSCGLFDLGYPVIAGAGANAAVLHYESLQSKIDHTKDILLVDAGGAFYSYSADITRSYPTTLDGKFTEKHKLIYNIVLDLQTTFIKNIKPGANYRELQTNLFHMLIAKMQEAGFLIKNATVDEMYDNGIHKIFMPHGTSHYIGSDVHDPADSQFCLPTILEPNQILSVEPGVYFVPYSLGKATEKQKKYLIMDRIKDFIDFGGVRIEDDILVTEEGYRVMTGKCVKSIPEIEKFTTHI